MIRGIHGLFYTSEDKALRAFLRDKLQLPATDVGGGWLIFDFAEGDLGVHPIDHGGTPGQHDISFFTDDLEQTVEELRSRGVEMDEPIADHGYGLVTHLTMPGGIRVQIYQPRYTKTATAKTTSAKKASAKKTSAKPAPAAKKTSAKKTAAKQAPAKPAPAKKTSSKKAPTKPAPTKKTSSKQAPAKQAPAKKTSSKKKTRR